MLTIDYQLAKSDVENYVKTEAKCDRKVLPIFIAACLLLITAVWGILDTFVRGALKIHFTNDGEQRVLDISSGHLVGLAWLVLALIFYLPKIIRSPYASLAAFHKKRSAGYETSASTLRGKIWFGKHTLTVSETHVVHESAIAINAVPWSDVAAIKVFDWAIVLSAKYPPSPIFAYIPSHAFATAESRLKFITICGERIGSLAGGMALSAGMDVRAGSRSAGAGQPYLVAAAVTSSQNAINIGYVRNADDIEKTLFWTVNGDSSLVTRTLFSPFIVPSLALLSLLPLWGTHVVFGLLGFFAIVLALAVLVRGRIKQAAAMKKSRFQKELRIQGVAIACLNHVNIWVNGDGFLFTVPPLGLEKYIPWRSVTDFRHDSEGIFLGGVPDATGLMTFVPARAFADAADMNMATEFIQKAINASIGPKSMAEPAGNRWAAI